MRRIPLLLATALLLPLAGCEQASQPPSIRISLADRLPEARVEGRRAADRHPPARVRDGRIVQRGGSRITVALALPAAARLRGEARIYVPGRAEGEGRLRITLRPAGAPERLLLDEPLSEDARLDVDTELSELADGLVALELAVDFDGKGEPAVVAWEDLAVVGSAPPPEASSREVPRGPYNVLVVLLDSLRADHLAPYDASIESTPRIARLAGQGATFSAARSTSSWTKPAVASLLTSRPPWGHGVVELGHVLPDVFPYLPELLADAGWRTLGVSATAMFSRAYGFQRGFPEIAPLWRSPELAAVEAPEARADWVWSRLIAPLASQDRPFFVYLHEIDPHSPYEPPEAYATAADRSYTGRRLPSDDDGIGRIRRRRRDYTAAEIAWLNEAYRGEVAAMDAYVGRLIGRLDAAGLAEDTLVVFLSDHGEEFDDHRAVGHGHTVHDELVRVPLLMRLPGVIPAGARFEEPVDLLDVAPTILDLLALGQPPEMLGRSLLPLLAGGALPPRASVASSRDPLSHGLVWGGWKWVRGPGERRALYDLASDPGEQQDLRERRPVVAEALDQMLSRHLRTETVRTKVGRQAVDDLTPDVREQLRELGYLE